MPCMKDYGKTWDYDMGPYSVDWVWTPPDTVFRFNKKTGEYTREERPRDFPKYRKVANQHGVIKFVRVS